MTDGVTKRYELTATRNVVYDVISTNITDPLTGEEARASVTDWIFNGAPETAKIGSLYKYPIVVIPYSDLSDENIVVDGSKDMITHSISIQVHARTRKDCVGTEVNGRTEANEMMEEIRYILKITGQSELRKGALFGPNIIGTTLDTEYIGGNKLYIMTMEVEFTRLD